MASKVFKITARVTFAKDADIKSELGRIFHKIESWSEPGYTVRVAANGSGRVLDLGIEVEVVNPTRGSYHIAGGISDELVSLSNSKFSIEAH